MGDEGKGSIVDALVRHHNSSLVVRYNGGFQASHNVYTDDNKHHAFHQFGSGTFAGAKTVLDSNVIINPILMLNEGYELEEADVSRPFNLMYVNRYCSITTPFHRALNMAREMVRKNSHGSTGNGIGETIRLAKMGLELTPAKLRNETETKALLKEMQHYCLSTVLELFHDQAMPLSDPEAVVVMELLTRKGGIAQLYDNYRDWMDKVHILGWDEARPLLLQNLDTPIIFEGAQGVLLDQQHGFHPYTTWANTTTKLAWDLIKSSLPEVKEDEVEVIGVMRTFMTRHGNGPLLTENNNLQSLVSDDNNTFGRFQGAFRTGHLDLAVLKYAIQRCGRVDSLALTHCDKIEPIQSVCVGYEDMDLLKEDYVKEASLEAFEFTTRYKKESPVMERVIELQSFIAEKLNIPITITSHGKQYKHKKFMGFQQLEEEDNFVAKPKAAELTTETKPTETEVVKTEIPQPTTQSN